MTVPFMYNSRSFNVDQIPYDFLEFHFSQFHYPDLGYSSKKKETQNFRTQKCDRERKNSHFRNMLNCI